MALRRIRRLFTVDHGTAELNTALQGTSALRSILQLYRLDCGPLQWITALQNIYNWSDGTAARAWLFGMDLNSFWVVYGSSERNTTPRNGQLALPSRLGLFRVYYSSLEWITTLRSGLQFSG